MKKLWLALLSFLGFGEEEITPKEQLQKLMRWISSQERLDECSQQAFQVVQRREPLPANGRPHSYEGTIKADCIKVDAALTDVYASEMKKKFGDTHYLISAIGNGISAELGSASSQKLKQKIVGKIAQSQPAADKLGAELSSAKNELHIFKGAHGLVHDAADVDVGNAWYLIVSFAIAEAIANMLFLRENIGTLTALFIAVAVAVINVGGNVWFGERYREKNHVDPSRASAGKINRLYAFFLIMILNSGIAWYRLYSHSITEGLNSAFILESAVLLVVGIALGIAAFSKGYALDDPYPGFGPLSRKVKDLEESWKSLCEQHASFCEEEKNQATSQHRTVKSRIESSRVQLSSDLPEINRLIQAWTNERRQLEHAYTDLQKMFKTIMAANHPDGAAYPQDFLELESNSQLNSYSELTERLLNDQKEFEGKLNSLIAEVDSSESELSAWISSDEARSLWRWPN